MHKEIRNTLITLLLEMLGESVSAADRDRGSRSRAKELAVVYGESDARVQSYIRAANDAGRDVQVYQNYAAALQDLLGIYVLTSMDRVPIAHRGMLYTLRAPATGLNLHAMRTDGFILDGRHVYLMAVERNAIIHPDPDRIDAHESIGLLVQEKPYA